MNLRAALLRLLTDLKKDGVLRGNVILRKTMLDECKGDKFEELLAIFSLIVLKKVLATSSKSNNVSSAKPFNLVPLVLSHRKAIQRDLEKRRELDLRARQQQRNINASIEALSEEAVAWKNRKAPSIPKNADTLKRLVRENWIGDSDWVETILHGVQPTPGLAHDGLQEDEDDDASKPLVDLDSRVRAQNARLAGWQEYLKSLQEKQRPKLETTRSRVAQQSSSSTRFGRHQDIAVNGNTIQSSAPDTKLGMRHVMLLEALDNSLSSKGKHTPLSSDQLQVKAKDSTLSASRSIHHSNPASVRLNGDLAARRTSDTSSQDTLVGDPSVGGRGRMLVSSRWQQHADHNSPYLQPSDTLDAGPDAHEASPPQLNNRTSLAERTRASLAQFETHRAKLARSKTTPTRTERGSTVAATKSSSQADGASLAERTRQSMSLLANVLEDNYQPRSNVRKSRSRHSKSKSMFIPSQRPRLERAWSEESLASAAKEDSFDIEADYESVFKSRPRLAMSPNLSPARNNEQLDADLEDALNKLTINSSSPDY